MDSECKDANTHEFSTLDDGKGTSDLRCMVVFLGKMFHSHCPIPAWDVLLYK